MSQCLPRADISVTIAYLGGESLVLNVRKSDDAVISATEIKGKVSRPGVPTIHVGAQTVEVPWMRLRNDAQLHQAIETLEACVLASNRADFAEYSIRVFNVPGTRSYAIIASKFDLELSPAN